MQLDFELDSATIWRWLGSLRARRVRRATSACAMGALARASSDVVVEILDFLDIGSVLQVGGACASLRRTTLLDRAWTPRLRTCWPGRFDVDAGALAQLATLEVDPRRLCLQCLPWRPRRGTGPDGASTWQSAFSWRPPWIMPESLHQPASAGDWFFVEIYESNNDDVNVRLPEHLRVSLPGVFRAGGKRCIKRLVARKVVRLEECDVDGFPGDEVRVPLNVDLDVRTDWRCFEVRVFMQLDGILVPLADTCCMDGDVFCASHSTNQWIGDNESLCVFVGFDVDDTAITSVLQSVEMTWWPGASHDGPATHYDHLGTGKQALRDFHKQYSARVISTIEESRSRSEDSRYSFACDYKRDSRNPDLFDFRFLPPPPPPSPSSHRAYLDEMAARDPDYDEYLVRRPLHPLDALM